MGVAPIRVVLVDDAPEIRRLLRAVLEIDGRFAVAGEAEDGKEAIDVVAELRPDVVVLDVEMPHLTGPEALPEILARAPGTPVLVYSSARRHVEREALAAGASAYREKGTDLAELMDLLADLAGAGGGTAPGPAAPGLPRA